MTRHSDAAAAKEIGEGIWRWERRHPEWHPGEFGALVASYAVEVPGLTLLIDPLVSGESDPLLEDLDRLAGGRVRILITIPYHARSAEYLWRRYRSADSLILGHALVAKRLTHASGFQALQPGDEVEGVARAHGIGRPVRAEMPVEIYPRRALVFGDAVVGVDGGLRVWESPLEGEKRRRWYRERLLPSLRRLTDLDVEHVLVTHGDPVLSDGRRALLEALRREPWQRPKAG